MDVLEDHQPTALLLDVGGVTFIDSTGLGALVGVRNMTSARGIGLHLLSPSYQVQRLLQLTSLEDEFPTTELAALPT